MPETTLKKPNMKTNDKCLDFATCPASTLTSTSRRHGFHSHLQEERLESNHMLKRKL
ncbi:hypothetical protein EGR_03044 [Echinococcus granulosus]|uniref:Uncharacterized protein n=1 Tax=Echinococcus granulosus TaxID=6210 RepID=W6ULU4_ECHGR|nr:hypothetical protein EGR_03044 [Echinococcus granulosus]EUB62023.1 hypothetical protein EGR_03044 [Echinococcus granulosus]